MIDAETVQTSSSLPFFVVGVGASAGGLEALEAMFDHLPDDTGMAFVVVQHLSPDHKSLMAELLARHTHMPVVRAEDGMGVLANHVYLIPPKHNIELDGVVLRLDNRASGGVNLPIDVFLQSVSRVQGSRCAAVIMSGTGSDGSHGLRAVRAAGGIVLAQEPSSAKFDGMPRSALQTGLVDASAPPEELPLELLRLVHEAEEQARSPLQLTLDPESPEYIEVMRLLREETGVDFELYKSSTVLRRLERRMAAHACTTLTDYLQVARTSPKEVRTLYRDLLISVTRFFRDEAVFDSLRDQLQSLLGQGETTKLRLWVCGCATGQEAYSLAMLLSELGETVLPQLDFKIFATDIDADAIEFAAAGSYDRAQLAGVSPARLERFFDVHGDRHVIRRSLRQHILFTRHDVGKDPPFTKVDLITCRNLLIYLRPSLQRRILATFHFALKPQGVLLLGMSETIGDLIEQFRPIDASSRIFAAVGTSRFAAEGLSPARSSARPSQVLDQHARGNAVQAATDALLTSYAPSAVLVDEHFQILHVFGDLTPILRVPQGAPSHNLLRMAPKGLSALLASALPRALRQGQESVYVGLDLPELQNRDVRLRVRPLPETRSRTRCALLVFELSTLSRPVEGAEVMSVSVQARQQLIDLQQELQHSKESLQAMVEELETSNEELQATNEELLAANEELQSTNEELHSVNEELHTVNEEYEKKIVELTDANNDIDNLLRGTRLGTLFLDRELRVRRFTPAVTEYIHLIQSDIGRPLVHLSLPPGLSVLEDVGRVLRNGEPLERPFDLRDRHVLLRMLPYLSSGEEQPGGVIITFIDVTELRESLSFTQRVLDSLPEEVAVLDHDGTITMVNAAWRGFAAQNGAPSTALVCEGVNYLDVCHSSLFGPDPGSSEVLDGIGAVLRGQRSQFVFEYPCHTEEGERWFLMHVAPLAGGSGAVVSHIDITIRKRAELEIVKRTVLSQPN